MQKSTKAYSQGQAAAAADVAGGWVPVGVSAAQAAASAAAQAGGSVGWVNGYAAGLRAAGWSA